MKSEFKLRSTCQRVLVAITFVFSGSVFGQTQSIGRQANTTQPIPMEQIGALAAQQYSGDGLSVTATANGARLRCAFQRLKGTVTSKGLWLTSSAEPAGEPFCVRALEVGRVGDYGVRRQSAAATPLFESDWWTGAIVNSESSVAFRFPPKSTTLSPGGVVSVDGQTVRFVRDRLTEEYSVSVDGVRQDFIIEQRPEGDGELRLELGVTGATVGPVVNGVRLTLEACNRRLVYHRLGVLDAAGRVLPARFEVTSQNQLAVVVDDADAVYPVRIDPTFSNADWVSMGGIPGANGEVLAAVADSSGAIYIGGNFTTIGEVAARCVAKWDGSSWSKLGDGLNGINVRAMAVSGADVYVGGNLLVGTNSGLTSVAKWNGSAWTNLGKVFGSQAMVYALAASGSNLYVGGDFTSVGGIAATNIARWDGNAWSAMGDGFNHWVWALATSDTNLYVAGSFTKSGTNSLIRIARWDGLQWLPLGTGIIGDAVSSLAVSSSYLYAAGSIVSAGGTPVNFIAKWDGNSWSAMGNGLTDNPTALAFYDGSLYAAGAFFPSATVVRWNGNTWSNLPIAGANFVPSKLLLVNGSLYAAGGGGNGRLGGVDRLEGNAWVALSEGVTSNILALAVMGNDLYAGGRFKTAGGHLVNHVAKWDGRVWSPLGSGVNTTVYALTVIGTNLYAGGAFTNAGGTTANRIAKWDGTAWSALGTGLSGDVLALATSGTNVYAGGYFNSAGGSPANGVARWNGSAWLPLGTGANSSVNALAVSEGFLYAGGYLTSAGSNPVRRIAKWNGNAWSAVGGGLDSYVYALAVSGADLYAGGAFAFATNAAGAAVHVNKIAKWDGAEWSPLGLGMTTVVNALAVSGTDLFAAGSPYSGVPGAQHVAKWDGNAWSSLGSGLNSDAFALVVKHTNLFVGGRFTQPHQIRQGVDLVTHVVQAKCIECVLLNHKVRHEPVIRSLTISPVQACPSSQCLPQRDPVG